MAVHRVLCLAVLLLTLASATAGPPSSASFQLPRHSLDGGAAAASSPSFALTGAIGQPDANAPASGGNFTLSGGFHRQAVADVLFSDGFESP